MTPARINWIGLLDDADLLGFEARAADRAHRGAVEVLVESMRDTGKVLIH